MLSQKTFLTVSLALNITLLFTMVFFFERPKPPREILVDRKCEKCAPKQASECDCAACATEKQIISSSSSSRCEFKDHYLKLLRDTLTGMAFATSERRYDICVVSFASHKQQTAFRSTSSKKSDGIKYQSQNFLRLTKCREQTGSNFLWLDFQ